MNSRELHIFAFEVHCPSFIENIMNPNDNKNDIVRIELTAPQKEQVKQAIGKDADSIELNLQELEERIAPRRMDG